MIKKILDSILNGKLEMPTLANAGQASTGPWGSKENPMTDPNIVPSVAGVLTLVYPVTQVSGALAITGITVPYADFQGRITLLPTGAFTWTTATNIAVAGTAVVGKALDFVYNPFTAKWYPSYVA